MTGGEEPGVDICALGSVEADLFLFETAAAMPPPNSAPAVNTAAWTITALGICLLRPKVEKIVDRVQNSSTYPFEGTAKFTPHLAIFLLSSAMFFKKSLKA